MPVKRDCDWWLFLWWQLCVCLCPWSFCRTNMSQFPRVPIHLLCCPLSLFLRLHSTGRASGSIWSLAFLDSLKSLKVCAAWVSLSAGLNVAQIAELDRKWRDSESRLARALISSFLLYCDNESWKYWSAGCKWTDLRRHTPHIYHHVQG